jgi:hypothetical protein
VPELHALSSFILSLELNNVALRLATDFCVHIKMDHFCAVHNLHGSYAGFALLKAL